MRKQKKMRKARTKLTPLFEYTKDFFCLETYDLILFSKQIEIFSTSISASLAIFSDISISLLSLVVTACGLALFGVSLFVSWKLCWIPWRERGLSPTTKEAQGHLNPTMSPLTSGAVAEQPVYTAVDPPALNRRESSQCSMAREPTPMASVVSVEAPVTPVSPPPVVLATPEAAMKISHTSPDIPLEAQSKTQENGVHTTPRMQRQTTEPPPSGSSICEMGWVENCLFLGLVNFVTAHGHWASLLWVNKCFSGVDRSGMVMVFFIFCPQTRFHS